MYISLTCYFSFPNAVWGGGVEGRVGDRQLNSNNKALLIHCGLLCHMTPQGLSKKVVV